MRFQAHRGVSSEFPENTLPAFHAAKEQGYHVIELDPLFTADNQCVTFHDQYINRTCRTNSGECIESPVQASQLTYRELVSYDAGVFMGERFRGTRVPLLADVMEIARREGLTVKIDNRFSDFPEQQQNMLFDIVKESGARTAFTCKNPQIVKNVVSRFREAEIHYDGYVDEKTVQQMRAMIRENPFTVWLPLQSELTNWVKVPFANPFLCEMVKRYAELGLWIVQTQNQYHQAVKLGADIIETNGTLKPRK